MNIYDEKTNDIMGGNDIHILLISWVVALQTCFGYDFYVKANIYEKSTKVTQNKIICTICQSAIKSARAISNRHTLTDKKRVFTSILVLLVIFRSYTIGEGVNCHSLDFSTVSAFLVQQKKLKKWIEALRPSEA